MRISKKAKNWWIAALGCAAVLLGIYLAVKSFMGAYRRLDENSNTRLMDIAWSADWNLATALTHSRSDLHFVISSCEDEEALFLSGEDTEALTTYFEDFPLSKMGLASAVIGIDGEKVLFSTGGAAAESYSFPFGCYTDKPCLCTKGEEKFLALVEKMDGRKLNYAVLLDLDQLYMHVAGATLTSEYWLVLYDTTTELLLQNKVAYPQVEKISVDELTARDDGTGWLVRNELNDVSGINTYRWHYKAENKQKEIQVNIATLPTKLARNGVFAVGVAVDMGKTKAVINQFMIGIVLSCLLALAGIGTLLVILYQDRRATNEMRERTRLLETENANMQKLIELSHLQRLELIGTMTSGIAHEFNNLLTPIMSYSILSMEKLPEENDELMDNLTEIYEASRRAKSLISRISALSQKSSGENYSLCSPDELVKKVMATALPSKPRDVSVETVLSCPDACLYVNNTQISQLLLNLILNAYQAMECCGSILRVSTRKENNCVHFIVSDNGPGIEQDIMPRIFEPFFTTKESGRGTGLGLAIAQRIAEEYDGCIEVKSVPGTGCEFKVILPVKGREKQKTFSNS